MSNPISRLYNEKIENMCTRILYFFNTIDTYFLLTGTACFFIVFHNDFNVTVLALAFLFGAGTSKTADFYPTFLIFAAPLFILSFILSPILFLRLFFINIALFFIIQFVFMGIPDSIVGRNLRIPFIKMYNSLSTIAPTTVSFSMSVFFSFYLSLCMALPNLCKTQKDYLWLGVLSVIILIGSLITRSMRPKNNFSKFHKPDIRDKAIFKRVVILNIDGARKDIFDSLDLPTINRLTREGSSHVSGLETIYRALTNPAFVSILTGTAPEFHGVYSNNLGHSIKAEGLPDVVSSIAYGSMHVKHFSKESWETRIVSLPRHSIYSCDDVIMEWLKDDMKKRPQVRLFIADFSEADFLAHAYGSVSKNYKEALRRIDSRIGNFIDWMKESGMQDGAAVIVCSDHGIAGIDHSYLLAESERYVPFLLYGDGIKKGFKIHRPGKIMDICCTVAYLLGIRYPSGSRGQVFTEALENSDIDSEKEVFVKRFNRLKYDAEALIGDCDHVEIYEGDTKWWDRCIAKFALGGKSNLRILDIGCGSGFIGERFIVNKVNFKEFMCVDISESALAKAREKLGEYPGFSFTSDLDNVKGEFDIITVSSVFHHVVFPEKLARVINKFLVEGGILIGGHEPNKNIFRNKLFYPLASLYKKIGGGVSISNATLGVFNKLLHDRYPAAPLVCSEEILQTVEYHSPIEQYDRDIDLQSGFIPDEFLKACFPGYEVQMLETYSTFFYRPWLSRHKMIQFLLAGMFGILFHEGNLFRFALRKEGL
ncbi:MAG: alkaline phosphatase family protein [Candidatus Omnitrophota bacterium]|nr:alkaline phosphatase family protein [Candidatus Omnitrophota bacterium]